MVNIDTVYQNVLALANKEQRGYITPQEFNLFANQAQMEIFEQYFYDMNQFDRLPGNNMEYSDPLTILREKIGFFKVYSGLNVLNVLNQYGDVNLDASLPNLYRLGTLSLNNVSCEPVGHVEERTLYQENPQSSWSSQYPVYEQYSSNTSDWRVKVFPHPIQSVDNLTCTYIRIPTVPIWGYHVVTMKALYNAAESTDFELHASESNTLIYKILSYAGITIKNPDVVSVAMALENKKIQQEKS